MRKPPVILRIPLYDCRSGGKNRNTLTNVVFHTTGLREVSKFVKVIHSLPGRMRVEVPEIFRSPGRAFLFEENLVLAQGIVSARANPSNGRVLVEYSPDLTESAIKEQLIRVLTAAQDGKPALARRRDKGKKDRDAFELESLPIAWQVLLTGGSCILLLYTILKRDSPPVAKASGKSRLMSMETALTVLSGYPIFQTALDHLLKKGRLSSELVAATATLFSLMIEESRFGLLVILLVYLSTLLRTLATEHARDRIRAMLEEREPVARVLTPEGQAIVPGGRVAPEAVVVIKTGEGVPVDGRVLRGSGLVNQCPVMGDVPPSLASEGDPVYAGSTVVSGELYVRAVRVGEDTYIGRVIKMLKRADRHFPPRNVRLMSAISFVSLTLSAGIYLFTGDARRAVAMLVVGAPGAAGMASSIPVGFAAGIGAGRGILLKSSECLENMGRVDTVLFDKTTLLSRENDYDLETISVLREAKVPHIGLLTGEAGELTTAAISRLKLEEAWPDCRPQDKVKVIRRLQKKGRIVAVVGDGTSDVPALSAADVGITLSNSDELDLESAGVIIVGEDPRQVGWLKQLARESIKVSGQNTALSTGANLLGLTMGAAGLLSPLAMALLQNGCTLAILLNSGSLLLFAESLQHPRILGPGSR